ncbi:hypothetical protein CEXT_657311 [Caerostris extrusa]|uniref:Uncharacterized protein n=1 Tax=Caerostris extrusa TaxID=172846 RepID=A0AAV4PUG1_CAEEX|nr:hypothetical protein CEXT_657311 [Caerostris extrusa]
MFSFAEHEKAISTPGTLLIKTSLGRHQHPLGQVQLKVSSFYSINMAGKRTENVLNCVWISVQRVADCKLPREWALGTALPCWDTLIAVSIIADLNKIAVRVFKGSSRANILISMNII